MADKIKKIEVEYKNCKVTYTLKKLEAVANDCGVYDYLEDEYDYMVTAVKYFCYTHFMYFNAAHLDSYDADTRGRTWQEYNYTPNGTFKGTINARIKD